MNLPDSFFRLSIPARNKKRPQGVFLYSRRESNLTGSVQVVDMLIRYLLTYLATFSIPARRHVNVVFQARKNSLSRVV